MVSLVNIVEFLDEYLQIDAIEDDSWNGLQVEGNPRVEKVLFAVDASIDTFKKAIQERADLVVVHHGHYWKHANPSMINWNKERIDLLVRNEISLYACHLPLDRHSEVGNNAQLLKLLDAEEAKEEFLQINGKNIGWIGELKQPTTIGDIEEKLHLALDAKCIVLPFGKKEISTVAVCSGGGDYSGFFEALAKKVDLYLTGDTVEIYFTAKDAGLNVIFAGHHATEIIGVKALSKVIRREFRIETVFIDFPTGL